jgi:serine/threonine protein kinase
MNGTAVDTFGLVGQLLDGQYRVDAVVGEGGYGVVYKGWHLAFEQPIAIKALKVPEGTEGDARTSVLTKFREEAKLSYVLSQASLAIVRCIGYGAIVTPSQTWAPYLVLDWLEGQSLAKDLEERRCRSAGGRSLAEVVRLLDPVAKALVHVHSQRVAHRDIKPANVFLVRDGGAKLLDFGIAKVMEEGATAANAPLTRGGLSVFTPYYAAPEQVDPRLGPTGPWTDVYAFALVLVEMLADKAPLRGIDVLSVLSQIADASSRPTPRALGVQVSDTVETLFLRALTVDPKARFGDLGSFWEGLEAAVRLSAGDGPSGTHGLASDAPGAPRVPQTIQMHPLGFDPTSSAAVAIHAPAQAAFHPPPHPLGHSHSGTLLLPAVRATQADPPIAATAGGPVAWVSPVPSAPAPAPRSHRKKIIAAVVCLLLLSMLAGAYLASEYVR